MFAMSRYYLKTKYQIVITISFKLIGQYACSHSLIIWRIHNDNYSTDVNGCTTSPCKNGGACENLFDGFKCTCAGEWLGRNCNVNASK